MGDLDERTGREALLGAGGGGDDDGDEDESEEQRSGQTGSDDDSQDDDDSGAASGAGEGAGDQDDDDDDDDEEQSDDWEARFERQQQTIKHQRTVEKELKNRIKALEASDKELKKLKRQRDKQDRDGQSEVQRLQSDLETATNERTELQGELERMRNSMRRRNVMDRLEQAGFDRKQVKAFWTDSDDIGVPIEYADNDISPKHAKRLVKAAREYDPQTYAPPSVDGGERDRSGGAPQDMNARIRSMTGRV